MVTSLIVCLAAAQAAQQTLKVDPLMIASADEVWSIIGQAKNPVWPGWDARTTPVLVYFPDKQDVLINHPKPPEGFVPYTGAVKSLIGTIFVRDGKTTFDQDGQNTSTEVGGVETLVVADTRSTLRQRVQSLQPNADPQTIADNLTFDPYGHMQMVAHEAFHVYQNRRAPNKGANEQALFRYPTLSVENNVGYALEGRFLAAALRAKTDAEARNEAAKWLVARMTRHAALTQADRDYEDGNEFNEGLAKYVEYKLLQVLPGHKPGAAMWWLAGFHGYDDLSKEVDAKIAEMVGYTDGSRLVNNDPYGSSPVRFRLYYTGMAVGAMLDRLGGKWHDRIFEKGVTLTSLATEALHLSAADLEAAKAKLKTSSGYDALVQAKQKLAADGAVYVQSMLDGLAKAPAELVIDFSQLKDPKPVFAYTPFGILRVDEDRNFFRLVPLRGRLGTTLFGQKQAAPALYDRKAKQVRLPLDAEPKDIQTGSVTADVYRLPGVSLNKLKGTVRVDGRVVTVVLSD